MLEHSGKLHVLVASRLAPPPEDGSTLLGVRGHRLSVTCALASADGSDLYTAGKEGHIIRWNMKDGKMLRILPRRQRETTKRAKEGISSTSGAARRRENAKAKGKGRAQDDGEDSTGATIGGMVSLGKNEGHTDEVWTLALSSDGRYLASGGKDRQIGVWSIPPPPTLDAGVGGGERWLKGLGGHKDSISALSFRLGSAELYSASFDRTLKLFDVTQLSYIETLFGHQDPVLSLSALRGETAVSAGGRDRTVRFWKIRDESQLVFRGGGKSKLREVLEGGELADETEGGKKGKTKEGKFFEGSLDCVTMIDEQNFLSGGDSG